LGAAQPVLTGLRALEPSREVASPAGAPGRAAGRAAERRRPADQVRVLDAVSRRTPRTAEDVARRAGLSVTSVQAALGALGLEGSVEERDGAWRSVPAG
ncbi:MAG: processing protein, partial [Subtercola sp.]|nr:processing protein [Subtercola sp.]